MSHEKKMRNGKIVGLVEPCMNSLCFVEAAYSRGYRVIVVVSSKENPTQFGYEGKYHDLIVADIRDSESMFHAIRSSPYYDRLDALIPTIDFAIPATSLVAERLNLRRIPYEAAVKARRKDLARRVYETSGLPNPKFAVASSVEDAKASAHEIGFPVVIKPTNCAASQHVFFVPDEKRLADVVEIMSGFKETYFGFRVEDEFLVEEYIDGPEFSVELFLKDGRAEFAVVTEKTTSELPYFVETSHTVPTSVCKNRTDELIDTAAKAMEAIGIQNGPSHGELKLTDAGPKIVELNGRLAGDNIASELIVNAFGVNLFETTLDLYLGNEIHIDRAENRASSIAYLIAPKKGTISSISGIEHLKQMNGVTHYDFSVKPGDEVHPPKDSEDRLGYVVTVADSSEEAKRAALEAIESIRLNYAS